MDVRHDRTGGTKATRKVGVVCTLVAAAVAVLAVVSYALVGESDTTSAARAAPRVNAWGDTHIPYRAGSGRFCEVAAEGTSIRPDMVNRLVFLDAYGARSLAAELRARDGELVAEAPTERAADLDAIAQAASRLYDGMEASGFDLQKVPDEILMSLSAPAVRPAFERTTTYLRERCDLDIWSVLSTV
jgi:hypothetical protein